MICIECQNVVGFGQTWCDVCGSDIPELDVRLLQFASPEEDPEWDLEIDWIEDAA